MTPNPAFIPSNIAANRPARPFLPELEQKPGFAGKKPPGNAGPIRRRVCGEIGFAAPYPSKNPPSTVTTLPVM